MNCYRCKWNGIGSHKCLKCETRSDPKAYWAQTQFDIDKDDEDLSGLLVESYGILPGKRGQRSLREFLARFLDMEFKHQRTTAACFLCDEETGHQWICEFYDLERGGNDHTHLVDFLGRWLSLPMKWQRIVTTWYICGGNQAEVSRRTGFHVRTIRKVARTFLHEGKRGKAL